MSETEGLLYFTLVIALNFSSSLPCVGLHIHTLLQMLPVSCFIAEQPAKSMLCSLGRDMEISIVLLVRTCVWGHRLQPLCVFCLLCEVWVALRSSFPCDIRLNQAASFGSFF